MRCHNLLHNLYYNSPTWTNGREIVTLALLMSAYASLQQSLMGYLKDFDTTVEQEDSNNFFVWRWDGEVGIFCWLSCSHQWLWHWAWCTSHKVCSFLLFCSHPHTFEVSLLFPSNFPVFTFAIVFSLKICRFIW